jgi:hypothetical protein
VNDGNGYLTLSESLRQMIVHDIDGSRQSNCATNAVAHLDTAGTHQFGFTVGNIDDYGTWLAAVACPGDIR